MTTIVHAHQGDSLDAIVHRHYGDTDMTEAVMDANPGLSRLGAILPHGTAVTLPARQPVPAKHSNLWD